MIFLNSLEISENRKSKIIIFFAKLEFVNQPKIVSFKCQEIGFTFTDAIVIKFFVNTTDAFSSIIEFSVQATAYNTAKDICVVEMKWIGTVTETIGVEGCEGIFVTFDTCAFKLKETRVTSTLTIVINNGTINAVTDVIEEH